MVNTCEARGVCRRIGGWETKAVVLQTENSIRWPTNAIRAVSIQRETSVLIVVGENRAFHFSGIVIVVGVQGNEDAELGRSLCLCSMD